jgi:hypothetical protein
VTRLAVVLWGACVVLAVPTVILLVLAPGGLSPDVDTDIFAGLGGGAFLVLGLTYASVGAIVTVRASAHRIGWVFCVTGLIISLNAFTWAYVDVALRTSHELPAATGVSVVNGAFGEATAAWLGLTLLLFPDGRLPSRRWRVVLALLLTGMAMLMLSGAVTPGPKAPPFEAIDNPIGLPGTRGILQAVNAVAWILVVVGIALSAAGLVVRLRRARGIERQQLKLVLAVGSAAAALTTLVMASWLIQPEGHLSIRMAVIGLVLASFPISAGIAILRYGLFEIDRIVSRTISYALVTIVLGMAYVGLVLLGQALFSSFAGGSNLAIAASTLLVAALFLPVRSRAQRFVDRRFYRRRYDAQRTLEGFGTRLREQIDLGTLEHDLRGVVTETMQPTHTSVWLRGAPS